MSISGYPAVRRCIASLSSQDFSDLKLLHHLREYFLPTPTAVPSTSYIHHLEKPSVDYVVQFKITEEEISAFWGWQS